MKIIFLMTGKTEEAWLREGLEGYAVRIRKYIPLEIREVPALKNTAGLSQGEWKKKESAAILKHLSPDDFLVLLDERGEAMDSEGFAGFLNRKLSQGLKSLVFVIGGPYGFDDSLKKKSQQILSLSRLTFPHQLVRLIFAEQLYRALTILRNEPYHHAG